MSKRSGEAVRNRNAQTPPPAPEPLRVAVPDCHTHMDMQSPAVPEIIAAAAAVGVTPLIQVGCDLPSSRWAAETAAEHPTVWAAVALHPNEAPRLVHGDGAAGVEAADTDWTGGRRPPGGPEALDAALAEIDRLAALPQVRAVGETGLDYFRTGPEGVAAQQESFRRHIDIAKRHGRALMIHDRDAHDDVLAVLAEEGAPETVVFHCFSGDADMAKVCAERGYYMSFAGNVTFASAQPLRDAAAVAPAELVLVETDAPFLTPKPYRGRPNAPYLIPHTLRALAATKGMAEDELAAAVAANAARAFGL
ncbi:TatD family hydrolase [Marinitenerispora sediminis]|uniref:AraC family transcriptional regulator n=1 Tax=Marinitenerispora sediminis TaxID=1931232 RepID=A0A368TE05_9ACTN|nr:TatD family hydrolase [Marinitenerispora sediminis]RCV50632.1 AraC family transcriptional regulator [Marinitenerispora sediminis]RCV57121.1 AraC family transcriptional regulator [Marinitenerispora sediminis]RCV62150.1 AraC family transcriptional regulator [Marinitenerispora sediminis]